MSTLIASSVSKSNEILDSNQDSKVLKLKYFNHNSRCRKSISSYSVDGEIHDVHASFLYQYLETTEPMNVVISCGTNNIASGDSAWSIIFQVNC